MIKTAICDDEQHFLDELHLQITSFFAERRIECALTDYTNGKTLAEHAKEFDLIFLDVQMDEQDGFKTAEMLRSNGFSGCLIFVTIMKNDMYKAFEYGAFDYLVKPLSQTAFEHTMERFLLTLKSNVKQLIITHKNEQRIINLLDALYCEVINRKIYLHLFDGNIIEYYGKISELEQRLGEDFFKSHRSYLVNLKYITGYNSNEITLGSSEKLPLSRGRKDALMSALINDIDNNGEV